MEKSAFGEFFKQRRLAMEMTLRKFCEVNGFDPGNISRLEHGRLPPPGEQKLQGYAKALKLKPGSSEWYEFFDLAAAERGRLPADLLTDEEVIKKLPVLFRTLRGQPVPDEQLDKLIQAIRRG